jgi:fluoroquinolone transport system permease protein
VPLFAGVVCLGMLYTLVGLGQVTSHDSVTAFLLPGAVLVTGILELPGLHVIAGPSPLWYLIPTQGSLLLMLGATETLATWQWVYAIVVSVVSIGLAFWWAKVRFASLIGLQKG